MPFSKFKTFLNSDSFKNVNSATSVATGLANTLMGISQASTNSTDSSSAGVASSSANKRSGWITAGTAAAATVLGALSFFSGGSTAPAALALGSQAVNGVGSYVAKHQRSVYG